MAGTYYGRRFMSASRRKAIVLASLVAACGTDASGPGAPVANVLVNPLTAALPIQTTVQLNAIPRDANGAQLNGRSIVWSSSAPGIATVSIGGLVTGVSLGTATITATSEGKSGTAS